MTTKTTKKSISDTADYSELLEKLDRSINRNLGVITAVVKSYDFFGEADSDEIQTAIDRLTTEQIDLRDDLGELIERLSAERDELQNEVGELKEEVSKNEGWAVIKIDSLAQREKIEAFVTSEIWPRYNERGNYVIP